MANLMDLVRELKGLNERMKAGEVLNAADQARRKELKAFLRTTLEAQGDDAGEASLTLPRAPRATGSPRGSGAPRK